MEARSTKHEAWRCQNEARSMKIEWDGGGWREKIDEDRRRKCEEGRLKEIDEKKDWWRLMFTPNHLYTFTVYCFPFFCLIGSEPWTNALVQTHNLCVPTLLGDKIAEKHFNRLWEGIITQVIEVNHFKGVARELGWKFLFPGPWNHKKAEVQFLMCE